MNPTTSGSTLPTWTKSRGPLMLACPVVLMPSVLTEVNKEQLYAHTVPWAINSPSVYPVPARIPAVLVMNQHSGYPCRDRIHGWGVDCPRYGVRIQLFLVHFGQHGRHQYHGARQHQRSS